VRLKQHLSDELEKIAARENRSLANLVNKLLEQAIEMDQKLRAQAALRRNVPDRPSSGSLDGND
jgi:predicted DNA-binding ribbon-helix-helix protein